MIGQAVALVQVPSQRVFAPKAAARCLDVHVQTLKKMTDEEWAALLKWVETIVARPPQAQDQNQICVASIEGNTNI